MIWYKTAQVRGEWWIIDGRAVFADSDVGDMGHEAYVLDHIRHEIAQAMGWDNDDTFTDWEEDKKEIIKNLIQTKELNQKKLVKQYGEDFIEQMPYKPQIFDTIATQIYNLEQEKLDVADGSIEAREYGMKNLGWKRMVGNNIQTQTLTEEDLNNICRGINDAYGDEIDDETTFNIEINSNSKIFWNIPISVMEQGVMAVAQHGDRGLIRNPEYASNTNWYKRAKMLSPL